MTYRLVLDSGALFFPSYSDHEEAHRAAVDHNRRAREGKERGDMVTLRYAVGIVRITPKPVKPSPKRAKRVRK